MILIYSKIGNFMAVQSLKFSKKKKKEGKTKKYLSNKLPNTLPNRASSLPPLYIKAEDRSFIGQEICKPFTHIKDTLVPSTPFIHLYRSALCALYRSTNEYPAAKYRGAVDARCTSSPL